MSCSDNASDSEDDVYAYCLSDWSETEDDEESTYQAGDIECSDHDHYDTTVVDERLRLEAGDVFRFVFEDSPVSKSFMMARQASDVQISAWTENPEDASVCQREVSYSLPYMSSVVKVTEHQTMKRLGRNYLVDSKSTSTGIPLSDAFNVITRYCIKRLSTNRCHLLVTFKVEYVKRNWTVTCASLLIESSVNNSVSETCGLLVKILTQESGNCEYADSSTSSNSSTSSTSSVTVTTVSPGTCSGNVLGQNSSQDTMEKEDFTDTKDSVDQVCNIPNNRKVYERCVDLGRQIRMKIEGWIELRKETAKQLLVIAEALEKVRRDVSIARVVGSSVGFAGGVAAIVGTVLSVVTAGIAAPVAVAVCGGLASAAGGVASGISQVVETVISGNDMKTAESALECDRQTSKEIRRLTEQLTDTLERLDMEGLSCEQKLTYFIFHQEFYASGLRSPTFDLYYMSLPEAVFEVASAVLILGGKAANAACNGVRIANIIGVAKAAAAAAGARKAGAAAVEAAGVAAEVVGGAGNFVRIGITNGAKVIAGVGIAAGGIGLVFDVTDIVFASIALAKEGKTESSEKLLATAKALEESAATMEGFLDQATDWFKETAPVVAQLDRLEVGDVTIDAELSAAESLIMKSIYGESNVNTPNDRLFVNNLKLFYDLIKVKLRHIRIKLDRSVSGSASQTNEAFVDNDSDNSADPSDCAQIDSSSVTDDSVDIVLIARADIPGDDSWAWETGSALVDYPGINDVTFYQPWNCAVDADVMHAVCRGELKPSSRGFKHCMHSGPRGQSRRTCSQKNWNSMTRAKQTPIPRIVVDPVSVSDVEQCDLNSSLCLFDKCDDKGTVRLVVPYAAVVSDKRSYRRVPLSIVCQAIGAACHVLGLTATVHVLCDLTLGDGQSHVSEIKQYCHVTSDGTDGRPTMTCRLTDPAGVTEFRQTVRRFLHSQ